LLYLKSKTTHIPR